MKRKMFAICTSIAALHLVIGGAVILGGCTGVQEDEPMPRGAQIPQQTVKPETPEVQTPPVQDPVGTPETVDAPKVDTPVISDPVVVEPAVTEVPATQTPEKPVIVAAPQKGDAAVSVKKYPHRANDVEYIVKKNDTYWGIAQKFGVSMKDLEAYNSIPAKKLRPGQKIMIPATGKKITKPVAKPTSVKVKKSYEPIPANGIYIVKKNDSYSKIAAKFGLRAADIAEYNNLSLTKAIQPNQKLKLPPRRKSGSAKKAASAVKTPAEKPAATPAVSEPAAPPADAPAAQPAETPAVEKPVDAAPVETPATQPAAPKNDNEDPFADVPPPAV